jgi:hypothetical protein
VHTRFAVPWARRPWVTKDMACGRVGHLSLVVHHIQASRRSDDRPLLKSEPRRTLEGMKRESREPNDSIGDQL